MRWTVPTAAILLAQATVAQASPELVVDLGTGRVLHAKEAAVPWHPASLTKLMTTYVALRAIAGGQLGWDSPVVVSAAALRVPPSRSGLPVGSRLTMADALRVLMVKSANDLAIAVAEAVSGDVSAFVAAMNAEAARLGMGASRWVNPHGLDAPAQVTTARDLAVLAAALRREFPQADPLFAIPSILLDGVRMANHNQAVGRVAGIDGMKTGYICASGFNVVTTAMRDGRRVAVVLLGRDSATERDARASLLASAALATVSPGIGTLQDYQGAGGAPPRRACGRKGAGEERDGVVPREAMDRWVRSFAALPPSDAAPIAITSLPGAAPAAGAALAARIPERPRPAPVAAPRPEQAPLAYVAPTVRALGGVPAALAPKRF